MVFRFSIRKSSGVRRALGIIAGVGVICTGIIDMCYTCRDGVVANRNVGDGICYMLVFCVKSVETRII
jgi:hypothetical protein